MNKKTNTYTLKKTPAGKKIKYEVFNQAGQNIGQRLSTREYVACIVNESDPNNVYLMQTWFGRVDLIGKGDSRHYVGQPGMVVVYLIN